MIPFVDFHKEYESLRVEVAAALDGLFARGVYVLGENVEAFELEFAAYCGARFAVGVGSGTEALHLALVACGIGPGDEVITAPNTAAPTALAVSASGARVVFADIDAGTYTMDPQKLESAITPATRAVIPVHLYGQTADMDPIMAIANKHNLFVIEDACQAHGAEYKGRKAGTIGHLGCFSFYPTKNLGAYGDGGMVLTHDENLHSRLKLLRNMGQTDRYHHKIKGFNSRLDEIQASILRVKLRRLPAWNNARRELAAIYFRQMQKAGIVLPREHPGMRHVYHLFVIRTHLRDELRSFLSGRGISTLIHYPVPLHLQEAYQELGYPLGAFPEAEAAAGEVLSLPMHAFLEPKQVQDVCVAILEFLSFAGRECR